MASPKEREQVTVESEGLDLGAFFESYYQTMQSSKESTLKQINSAYDSLVSGANAQKSVIESQADQSFREIYANAKVSAQNQNEQLAAMGLSKGSSMASSSGYSETSRIRADNAMRNNLSNAASVRDTNLAAVDTQIGQINADRAKEIAETERSYSDQMSGFLQTMMQTEFNYYTWQQEFDYQKEQDASDAAYRAEQFAYQKEQDSQAQKNYEEQFAYQKEQDASDAAYRAEQFAYQKEQDSQAQKNYEEQFAYQKEQDAADSAYQKEQDAIYWAFQNDQFAYQKQQDSQAQQNYENEFAYQKQQDSQAQKNYEEQFAYQKQQDSQAQQNYENEFAYQKQLDEQEQSNWLMEYLLKAGNQSSSSGSSGGGSSGSGSSDSAGNTGDTKQGAKATQEQVTAYQNESKFQQYLSFASSTASFPTDEAYASYFDQLYRQKDITADQYKTALQKRGFSSTVINLRLGLL